MSQPYRHVSQSRAIAVPLPAPQPLTGFSGLCRTVADWPDRLHVTLSCATAALAVWFSDAGTLAQLAMAAGLFTMGVRLFMPRP